VTERTWWSRQHVKKVVNVVFIFGSNSCIAIRAMESVIRIIFFEYLFRAVAIYNRKRPPLIKIEFVPLAFITNELEAPRTRKDCLCQCLFNRGYFGSPPFLPFSVFCFLCFIILVFFA